VTTVHSSRESAPAGRRHRRGPRVRGEQGFALIEALVAATLLVIMALGFLAALDAAARSSADNKGRAQAASLAQQDMERMRALNVTDLTGTNATRTQVVGNVTYTIASKAVWIDDSTGNATCSGGASNADYLKVSSTVTWPTMGKIKPVTSTTIVAVPNGSFGSGQGSIQALVEDHTPTGIPGLPVNLSGPSTGTLSTDGAGCVFWGYLPVGTYTVALNQAGYVDWKGQQSVSQTQDVVGGSTSNFVFDYDRAANLDVSFDTQVGASTQVASAKSIMLGNASLTTPRQFTSGTPATTISSGYSLFPFGNGYAVWGGSCVLAQPSQYGQAMPTVTPAPGGTQAVTIRLPALNIVVNKGGSPFPSANVRITPVSAGCGSTFTATLNAAGKLAQPGLPYGDYTVCADDNNGASSRRVTAGTAMSPIQNRAPAGTTTSTLSIPTSGGTTGPCP